MAETPKPPETADEYRALVLSLIGSLTLCDHMGDVSNDVQAVLDRLGINIEWYEWHDLGDALGRMGVTTLYGTSLVDEPDEDEDYPASLPPRGPQHG